MRPGFALAAVTLLAGALRIFPIWFGLPHPQARPDETTVLGHAVAMLAGDPNPHFFNWPSLTFYFLAGIFSVAGIVRSALTSVDYTLLARACMALAGTATVLLTARLTRRVVRDETTAVVAALLLTVAVLHVRDSHFALTDTLMTLLAAACLTLLVEAAEAPRRWLFALAGIAGGLATSTKYSAAALLIAVLAVRAGWRERWLFALAFAAAFLAGTPYAILDVATFRADVLFERAHLAAGHTGLDLGSGWTYHLTRSLPYGVGMPAFIAAIGGLVPLWKHHRRAALPLAAFASAFFLAIGSGRTVFFRYILPLLPLACVSAAVGIRALATWAAPRVHLRPPVATAALALAVAAPALADTVRMDLLLARTDTRVLAADWLATRLRPGDTLHDAGGAYAKLSLGRIAFHEWRYDPATRQFVNAGTMIPDWLVVYDYAAPLRHYAPTDPGIRALARTKYSLAHQVVGLQDGGEAVFDREDAFFVPVHGFRGVDRPGPNVSIYRRADLAPTAPGGR